MKNSRNDILIRRQVDALGRPTIDMLDREIARLERKQAYMRLLFGAVTTLLVTGAALIIITHLWFPVLRIEDSSMSPLLEKNQAVVAFRTENLDKGNVIAFYQNGRLRVRHIVALSGDEASTGDDALIVVPVGMILVLEDNEGGTFELVNREQVLGKVAFRVWPLTQLGRVL